MNYKTLKLDGVDHFDIGLLGSGGAGTAHLVLPKSDDVDVDMLLKECGLKLKMPQSTQGSIGSTAETSPVSQDRRHDADRLQIDHETILTREAMFYVLKRYGLYHVSNVRQYINQGHSLMDQHRQEIKDMLACWVFRNERANANGEMLLQALFPFFAGEEMQDHRVEKSDVGAELKRLEFLRDLVKGGARNLDKLHKLGLFNPDTGVQNLVGVRKPDSKDLLVRMIDGDAIMELPTGKSMRLAEDTFLAHKPLYSAPELHFEKPRAYPSTDTFILAAGLAEALGVMDFFPGLRNGDDKSLTSYRRRSLIIGASKVARRKLAKKVAESHEDLRSIRHGLIQFMQEGLLRQASDRPQTYEEIVQLLDAEPNGWMS